MKKRMYFVLVSPSPLYFFLDFLQLKTLISQMLVLLYDDQNFEIDIDSVVTFSEQYISACRSYVIFGIPSPFFLNLNGYVTFTDVLV